MPLHKRSIEYSDSDPADPAAVHAELLGGITRHAIIDNSRSGTGKYVLISMWYNGGGPMTLDQGPVLAGENDKADLSSLGEAFNRFQISWKIGSQPWQQSGMSAPPGKAFAVIGISWDQHDNPNLIHVLLP